MLLQSSKFPPSTVDVLVVKASAFDVEGDIRHPHLTFVCMSAQGSVCLLGCLDTDGS